MGFRMQTPDSKTQIVDLQPKGNLPMMKPDDMQYFDKLLVSFSHFNTDFDLIPEILLCYNYQSHMYGFGSCSGCPLANVSPIGHYDALLGVIKATLTFMFRCIKFCHCFFIYEGINFKLKQLTMACFRSSSQRSSSSSMTGSSPRVLLFPQLFFLVFDSSLGYVALGGNGGIKDLPPLSSVSRSKCVFGIQLVFSCAVGQEIKAQNSLGAMPVITLCEMLKHPKPSRFDHLQDCLSCVPENF